MTKSERDDLREHIAHLIADGLDDDEIQDKLRRRPHELIAIIRDLITDKPRVVAYVEGGVVQGARASEILDFGVCDYDDEAASGDEYRGVSNEEYDALPFGVF